MSPVEDKINEAVAVGSQVAQALAPQYAPVIAEGAALEPEIYHLVSALIHLFRKNKKQ